jgi:hypothetical protein
MATTQLQSDQQPESEKTLEGSSRTLIYCPIIHTQADMGALKDPVSRATLEKLGRAGLPRHLAAIDQRWTEIEQVLHSLPLSFDRVRLYQDGLPVCGREAEIVRKLARDGNRNHQLLERLMSQGGILMGTESSDLLVQEYRLASQSFIGRQPRAAGIQAQRRALSQTLLAQRDQFIARRINETLKPGETGILFVGMLHSLERYLDRDIKVLYPLHRC